MHYQTVPPPRSLEPYVDCFWLLATPEKVVDPQPEIVLPDGKTELIVHFGDPFTKLEDGGYECQASVLLSGQLTKRILLKPTGTIGIVSARFKPAGAARFFQISFPEIVDQVIDFSQYEPQTSAQLLANICAATSHDQRLEIMISTLESLFCNESQEDIYVRTACQYITRSEGEYTVQDLVKLIGFSERQLQRKFKKQVGIAPKVLSKIMRFQKFIALSKNSALTLTEAAAACGYYDQPHFIRDFTQFSGVSPLNYLNSKHPMSDHLTTPTAST